MSENVVYSSKNITRVYMRNPKNDYRHGDSTYSVSIQFGLGGADHAAVHMVHLDLSLGLQDVWVR